MAVGTIVAFRDNGASEPQRDVKAFASRSRAVETDFREYPLLRTSLARVILEVLHCKTPFPNEILLDASRMMADFNGPGPRNEGRRRRGQTELEEDGLQEVLISIRI